MTAINTVEISYLSHPDTDEFLDRLGALSNRLLEARSDIADASFEISDDLVNGLFRVAGSFDCKDSSADALNVGVSVELTEAGHDLLAALRAGEADLLIVERLRHFDFSVCVLNTPTVKPPVSSRKPAGGGGGEL